MAAPDGGGRGSVGAEDRAGPRALLVMREALANLVLAALRHGRFETRVATDLAECQRLVADWKPHLAMIDLDGYRPLVAILAGGATPVIVFTRRREASVKLGAFEMGADDIIEVPFTLDEIVARPFALMRRA